MSTTGLPPRAVFYFNPGVTPALADVWRRVLPQEWELLLWEPDTDPAPALGRCDYLIIADQPLTRTQIDAAPRLRMVQHQGVGYERIDLEACRRRGIPVALCPDGTTTGVAEHTVLLMLALYKQLPTAVGAVNNGGWPQWRLRDSSFELAGKTVGLLGFGRIGQAVARRLVAFDAQVLFWDPAVLETPPHVAPEVLRADSLELLLEASDIISLHMPLTPKTRGLADAGFFRAMRPGGVLINTARGGLVDDAALIAALETGHLAGAALDVLSSEPPPADHPLLGRSNVIVTPHIAAGTLDALRTKARAAAANLVRFERGEPILHGVPELS